jgi:phosphoglucomutase
VKSRGLVSAYYAHTPEPSVTAQRVAFGASGHHGSALNGSFNEAHALSISQAICDYRNREGIYGPVFLGIDTSPLSTLAFATSLEVLAANGVEVLVASNDTWMPARAVSCAILTYNRGRAIALADGIVIAPSDDPPEDGCFQYTLPHGRSPDIHARRWIDTAANEYLRWGSGSVRTLPYEQALAASTTRGAALLASNLTPGDYIHRIREVAGRGIVTVPFFGRGAGVGAAG